MGENKNAYRFSLLKPEGKRHLENLGMTQWSRIFLKKLIVSQLIRKFPAFYGIRRFIPTFTRARHLSLS
jgi:hypothetical protein